MEIHSFGRGRIAKVFLRPDGLTGSGGASGEVLDEFTLSECCGASCGEPGDWFTSECCSSARIRAAVAGVGVASFKGGSGGCDDDPDDPEPENSCGVFRGLR